MQQALKVVLEKVGHISDNVEVRTCYGELVDDPKLLRENDRVVLCRDRV